MFLEGGTRDHFMRWLADAFPHMVDGYRGLYAGKYAPASYRKEVSNVLSLLRKKYGVNGRDDDSETAEAKGSAAEEAQPPTDQPIFQF
jgi:hypothetical protein